MSGAQRGTMVVTALHRNCPLFRRDQQYTVLCASNSRTNSNLAGENVTLPNLSWIVGCVAAGLAQSGEHSPCKRGVPGSRPGRAAHFSPPGDT
ncbi:hypothetical protein DPMN_030849 [Dreissena polymorpha]|uniref:Uncharacterized protein n=1 Tax=Dreissena polymorpha TaxID=45954 RepID=A0A9D4M3E9_DREPO|nr:hypothetical protein DPMN_030849 [Dreissena polymorpha]